jgi:hypothetical protein
MSRIKVQERRYGVRLLQGDALLSKVLRAPGPTDEIFDVLAARIAIEPQTANVALLGFAGGGMVAPLRASGWQGTLRAVDLDPVGAGHFRQLCGTWAGEVDCAVDDAVHWLRSGRRKWDLIVEDLSVSHDGHVQKPDCSLDPLPDLARRRLTDGGAVMLNLLPGEDGWRPLYKAWRAVRPAAAVIHFDEFENRFLMLEPTRSVLKKNVLSMRERLEAIGSKLRRGWRVRPLAD